MSLWKRIFDYHFVLWFLIFKAIDIFSPILVKICLKNESFYFLCTYLPFLIYLPLYGLYLPFGAIFIYFLFSVHYKHKTDGRSWFFDKRDKGGSYRQLINFYKKSNVDDVEITKKELSSKAAWNCDGIPLGMYKGQLIYVKIDNEGKRFLIVGASGTRKSQTYAIPAALRFGDLPTNAHFFCLDIKPEIGNYMPRGRKYKIFNPNNVDISCSFDLFRPIRREKLDIQESYLTNLARTICGHDPNESQYFIKTGIAVFVGTALTMLGIDENVSFFECIRMIINQPSHEDLINYVIDENVDDRAVSLVESLLSEKSENVSGAFNTIKDRLRPFYLNEDFRELLSPAKEISEYGSLDRYMKKSELSAKDFENGYDIFVQIESTQIKQAEYQLLLGLITEALASELLMTRKAGAKNAPVLFILDEFPQINHCKSILQIEEVGRQFNISVMILAQSFSQFQYQYSKAECDSFYNNSDYVCVLSASGDDAKFFADEFGTVRKLNQNFGRSDGEFARTSVSASETREFLIRPEQFKALKKADKVAIIYDGLHALADIVPYYKWPADAKRKQK